MRGPRIRTLAAALVFATALLAGTVNSSEAARKTSGPTRRKHSTSVKPKSKTSKQDSRRAAARRRSTSRVATAVSDRSRSGKTLTTHHASPNRKRLAGQTKTHPATAPQRTAVTSRADRQTQHVPSQRRDSTGSAPAEIRSALARRLAWNAGDRRSLEPVTVKDPPADSIGEPLIAASGRPAPAPAVGPKMASRGPALEQVENEDLIREALRKRGTPYVWGGASRGGWDCSGFVCYIFRSMRGIELPHSASAQFLRGAVVNRDALQPGDLVFFSTYRPGVSHVGIFIGDNRFIHAANTRRDTRIDAIEGYYARRFVGARRITTSPLRLTQQQLNTLTDPVGVTFGDAKP